MELRPEEKIYFKELFGIADADKDGKIGLADAAFFRKSSLPDTLLGKVRNQISEISICCLEKLRSIYDSRLDVNNF